MVAQHARVGGRRRALLGDLLGPPRALAEDLPADDGLRGLVERFAFDGLVDHLQALQAGHAEERA